MSDKKIEVKLDGYFDRPNANGVIYPKQAFVEALSKGVTLPITLGGIPIGQMEVVCNKTGTDAIGFATLDEKFISPEQGHFSIRGSQSSKGDLNIQGWNWCSGEEQ